MPRTSKTRPVDEAPKPRRRSGAAQLRLSSHRKPEGMSLDDWQVGLRRQFR